MLVIVVVTIIATLWLSTKHQSITSFFKTNQIDIDRAELKLVKQRLLQYAVLQPEVYLTTGGVIKDSTKIPSPGYFPCPDLDDPSGPSGPSDGFTETTCTNPLVPASAFPDKTGLLPDLLTSPTVFGYVPGGIDNRNIHFAEQSKYFYFLDERFSYQNGEYTNNGLQRYAPLYPGRLVGNVDDATDNLDSFDPVLTLNGVPGYVVLIIDPGSDGLLDTDNEDGDRFFTSSAADMSDEPNADKIVGITYTEWLTLMVHRVCHERDRIEGIEYDGSDADAMDAIIDLDDAGATLGHWFNNYVDTTNVSNGANWREWGVLCP